MIEDSRTALRSRGLRVTAQRVAVLEVLRARRNHLRVEEVLSAVRARLKTASTQTIYSALATLTEAGLARRIEPAGSPALFEARVADNHHHVVCRSCGAVADIDCVVGETPCLTPDGTHGFVLDEAEVTFWGICPDCQRTQRDPSRSPLGASTQKEDHR